MLLHGTAAVGLFAEVDIRPFAIFDIKLGYTPRQAIDALGKQFPRNAPLIENKDSELGRGRFISRVEVTTSDFRIVVRFVEVSPDDGPNLAVANGVDVRLITEHHTSEDGYRFLDDALN